LHFVALCVCEDNWMLLEYEGGETYGTHCGNEGKRTLVMITCKSGETTVYIFSASTRADW